MKVPTPKKMTSGNWYINMRLGGESINVTEPTERACVRSAQLIKAEYLAGKRQEKLSPQKITLTQAIDKYIAKKEGVLSPSTIRGYRNTQKHHFPELMNLQVSAIDETKAQASVSGARKTYSAKTIRNSWAFIQTVIEDSTGRKLKVKTPQIIKNQSHFLDPEEISVFTKAIHGTRWEIPALFALCSLRQSEILGLDWKDVDLTAGTAFVGASVVFDEHHKLVKKTETKNQSSRRTVPLIPQLITALSAVPEKSGPVVKQNPSSIYEGINKVCKANNLPEIGLHGLRHSFASLAYSLGMPEKITMEIGGWSDDATMKKIYTHIAQRDRQKAQNAMIRFYESL